MMTKQEGPGFESIRGPFRVETPNSEGGRMNGWRCGLKSSTAVVKSPYSECWTDVTGHVWS